MSDLIARLRAPRPRPGYAEPLPPHPWMVEAADEIEQLTRERDSARDEAERMRRTRDAIIERLRAALAGAVGIIKTWHLDGPAAEDIWDIYWLNAPEMKPIREALGVTEETSEQ